jgi:two-component system sensor histidine kinase HydH
LEFAGMKEGIAEEAPTVVVGAAVSKTAELLAPRAARQNAAIEFNPAELEVDVQLPESQLRQIFLNLFLNALDAMSSDGTIRIGMIERNAHHVRLFVEDTGPGVSAAAASKIFDPFFTSKPHGTGLGLAIVARILIGHGGQIVLAKNASPGARFEITMPAAR